jgi:hypothetical protein
MKNVQLLKLAFDLHIKEETTLIRSSRGDQMHVLDSSIMTLLSKLG